MVLAAILSLLTGTVATVQHVATGDVGIDKNLCVEGQGHPEFGSVSWYKEGYDCPLQWGSILNAIVIYSAAYSPLYFICMAFYIAHRFAVARQAQRDAQQTRADARSGGQSEAGILQTWEAFGAWLRRRPIIHSAALTVVLSTLTAVPLTAYLTAGGGVGNPPDLCRPHKGYTGFGDISWGDGVYCTPQWDTIIWVHLLFTMMVSLPFVLWMFAYTTYRYSVERREAEQARADICSGGKGEAGILRTWEAFRAWLRRRPIFHSTALTVILSLLTGTVVTAIMVLEGAVGFEPHLCDKSRVDPEFGSVSWYMEGYDCPLQWWSILNAFIPLSILFSLPYVA